MSVFMSDSDSMSPCSIAEAINRMNGAVIVHSEEQVTGLAIVGKIISERTNSLTKLIRIGRANCPLYSIAFQIVEQSTYFLV